MKYYEYLIVGAGPAGLQMGYFLHQAQRNYLILEAQGMAGSFFATYPIHRTLISINKRFNFYAEQEFNMRHDWNSLLTDDYSLLFKDYSADLYPNADDICRYLVDFAEKYAIQVQYNSRVTRVEKATAATRAATGHAETHFVVTAGGEQYACRVLLMATGPVRPNIPDIEGIELAEGYEVHDIAPERFENKRVAVMGSGNSAFEIANHLAGHAASIYILTGGKLIKHAWQTHFVGHLRAINNTILDMFQLKSMHATIALEVKKIAKRADGTFALYWESPVPHWEPPGAIRRMYVVDHVIRATGWKYTDPAIFAPDCLPDADAKDKYPILDASWESSVPHLFYIGTAMAARDRKAASGFIHGFRYNIRTLFRLLEARYQGVALPEQTFPLQSMADLQALTDHLLYDLSNTAALFQLYGVLCHVLVFDKAQGKATLLRDLPLQYVLDHVDSVSAGREFMTLTLEFGFDKYPADANALDFIHPAPGAECAAFLHPVFRYYVDGKLVSQRNLDESLSIRFDEASYEPDERSSKPSVNHHILINFINQITRLCPDEIPLALVERMDGFSRFIEWAPDDPRIAEHANPTCVSAPMKEVGWRLVTPVAP